MQVIDHLSLSCRPGRAMAVDALRHGRNAGITVVVAAGAVRRCRVRSRVMADYFQDHCFTSPIGRNTCLHCSIRWRSRSGDRSGWRHPLHQSRLESLRRTERHAGGYDWLGVNYLRVCDNSVEPLAQMAYEGIRRVLRHEQQHFIWSTLSQPGYPALVHDASLRHPRHRGGVLHHQPHQRHRTQAAGAGHGLPPLHDPLTGLANRRLFNSFLHNEWRRSMREQTPISFIMLDLDNFKLCNDHFGHQVGTVSCSRWVSC